MTKTIKLSQGQVALVDDSDYEWVSQWKWYAFKGSSGWYAGRKTSRPNPVRIRMHREILAAPAGVEVDHRNGRGLDNRRCNLRLATRSQNQRNVGSGVKGVGWCHGKWQARIKVDGIEIYLGRFRSFDDAVEARRLAAIRYHGKFAWEMRGCD